MKQTPIRRRGPAMNGMPERRRAPELRRPAATRRTVSALATVLVFLTVPGPGAGQETQVTLGGQVRPRMESRSEADVRETFTSMRVRAQMQALLTRDVRVFIQVQDVRLFGEETSTLGDFRADGFDLHQGYLQWGFGQDVETELRVGRQALVLGEQRLVGAVNWTQQGRSFDGARLSALPAEAFKLDVFAMKLQEASSGTYAFDGEFLGAYGTTDLGTAGSLDLYALLVRDSREEGTEEGTFGALWKGRAGPVDLRLEGSLQRGDRRGQDVSAYMLGARAGVAVHEKATLTLWYDHLSGDDDPEAGEVGVFNTLFATNHAFYGYADYFLNIPEDTGGLGLRDLAVKLTLDPDPDTQLRVDLHAFSTAEEGELSTRRLANELDLTLTQRITPELSAMGGFSWVQALDGMEELDRLEENANWAYLMLNVVF